MRLSLYPDQRLPWTVLAQDCRDAETDGWDGIWLCDHLLRPTGERAGYFLECWTVLAALAARLPRITLGSLVSANSLRHPSLLAVMAATVQQISNGRLILGVGAGGDDDEHGALGLPFPAGTERIVALAEACQVLRALLSPGPAYHLGQHYSLQVADTGLQEPLDLPLLIGATGPRGLAVVAQYGDRWAIWGNPAEMADGGRGLDELCLANGRAPATLGRSAIVMLVADEPSGPWPAVLPAGRAALQVALEGYQAAGVDELIVCDYALPRDRRSGLLRELHSNVAAWTAANVQ